MIATQPRPTARSNDAARAVKLCNVVDVSLLAVLAELKRAIGSVPTGVGPVETDAADRLMQQAIGPVLAATVESMKQLERLRNELIR